MPEARDVFDLRRNGQSEEAYALAKSLFSTEPDSIIDADTFDHDARDSDSGRFSSSLGRNLFA